MADDEIPYFSEKEWMPVVKNHEKGYLMFSGEALKWAGKNTQLQIANPDIGWRLHPYEPPFVGYRGAVNLVNLWVNEYTLTH
jgi:nitrogenase molybdenum-iron protein alpha/beta subunit